MAAALGRLRSAGLPDGGGASAVPQGAAIRVSVDAARRLIHPRWSLIHPEWTTRYHSGCKPRRKIREEFAAIVVHAPAGANHDLVAKYLRAPGYADARPQTPLTSGESGIADTLGREERIVSGDDETIGSDGVAGGVVAVS